MFLLAIMMLVVAKLMDLAFSYYMYVSTYQKLFTKSGMQILFVNTAFMKKKEYDNFLSKIPH